VASNRKFPQLEFLIRRLIRIEIRVSYPYPELAYPCALCLSPGSPLPSGTGLWILSSTGVRHRGFGDVVFSKIREKLQFHRKFCYHAVDERIRL
jgi:hypothetical protein